MKQSAKEVIQVWSTKNGIKSPNSETNVVKVAEQIASIFSPGSCYYFIFNFNNLTFELLKGNIETVLGIPPEEMNLQYFFKILHPEDLEKYHEKEKVGFDFLMNHIPTEDIPLYKVVYLFRLKHKNGGYKTIMHQSRTINISKDGRVQQVLCVHTDLTSYNTPIDHSISFLSDSRTSYFSVATTPPYTFNKNVYQLKFTKRENEIILEMAKGKTTSEIAITLNIALSTLNTHKRNILKKSGCKNTAALITSCIRSGII